jgi:hypothetical protein
MNKSLTKKNIFLGLIVVLLLLGGSFAYKNYSQRSIKPTESSQESELKINPGPPTEQELSETTAHKETLSNENQSTNPNTQTDAYGKIKVTPVITSVSQDELRAYISGTFEDGGICTATFEHESVAFTKQSSGFSNVNTTNCGVIKLSRSDFPVPGEWTVRLDYDSSNSAGTSERTILRVQ